MPTEIDVVERAIMQHEMERQALKKEKDSASKERLKKLEKELAELKEKSTALKAEWQKEKAILEEQRKMKLELDRLRTELEQALKSESRSEAARQQRESLTSKRLAEALTSRYFVVKRETLHQSPVVLTPYQSETRIDERAVGDIVNTASRIQGLNKVLGTRTMNFTQAFNVRQRTDQTPP